MRSAMNCVHGSTPPRPWRRKLAFRPTSDSAVQTTSNRLNDSRIQKSTFISCLATRIVSLKLAFFSLVVLLQLSNHSLILLAVSPTKIENRSILVTNQAELSKAIQRLTGGMTIELAPGKYRGGLYLRNVSGTAESPIVITSKNPKDPSIIDGGETGIHLSNCQHIQLKHLRFQNALSNGINIDDGGDPSESSSHIQLQRLTIENVGPKGNRDAIKLSGVQDFQVIECNIENWGDAGSAIDMVGCKNGSVLNCRFIFRESIPANGLQTKGGTSNVTIESCRFLRAGSRALNIGGSTGRAYFRPINAPYEAKQIIVRNCTIIGSDAAVAFVGVDGATFEGNTIYRPSRWIFRVLQESTGSEMIPCRDVTIENNLIIFEQKQIRSHLNIGAGTSPETFQMRGNHWYCIDQPGQSRPSGLPVTETAGVYGKRLRIENEGQIDMQVTAVFEGNE